MLYAILILAVTAAVLAFLVFRFYGAVRSLRGRVRYAVPYLKKAGWAFEALDVFGNPDDWKYVGSGGNNQAGNIGGLGFCPCQKEYTVNTRQSFHARRPNAAQLAACLNNPPLPDPAEWECPDDCIQVRTHLWHGWDLFHNARKQRWLLNCQTYAQYHCKKPDDPDANKPPAEGPPPPDIEG